MIFKFCHNNLSDHFWNSCFLFPERDRRWKTCKFSIIREKFNFADTNVVS